MNFRTTALLFGLLLTTLWVFGLMIAHRKGAVDQAPILPTLAAAEARIDKVVIKNADEKGKPITLEFVNIGDRWFYKEDKQQVRVQGARIKEIIDEITRARPDETADLAKDLASYGLAPPKLVVTLHGKVKDEAKEWTFNVGDKSPDGTSYYYVNSSERSEKAYAVPKRNIDRFFITNANNLREKRLFDPTEAQITAIEIAKGAQKLEIKRSEGNIWIAVEPKGLGYLGHDSAAPDDKMPEDKFHKQPDKDKKKDEPISGVKALLSNIIKITVENDADLLPLGKPLADYDLENKTAPMRIEISTADEGKAVVKETLLIGKKVPDRKDSFYYARLAADDGVFILPAKIIEPIEKALEDPGKLRSLDIAVFDPKNIDYVSLKKGSEEIKLFHVEPEREQPFQFGAEWSLFVGKKKEKAYEEAVKNLIDHALGKKAIVEFVDVAEVDMKKKLDEFELSKPAVELTLYANAIEKAKKDEKKDVEKKKDETKKDEGKKDDKDKKDKLPELKKDAKAALKLEFGKIEKDKVYVRRTLDNGTTSLFLVKKEFLDKIAPSEGIELAYLDTRLPEHNIFDILSLKLQRTTDKGPETVELDWRISDGRDIWFVKDPTEPTGRKLAEGRTAASAFHYLGSNFAAQKYVKKLDDKDDLDKYGLKNPAIVATLKITKQPEDIASTLATLGLGMDPAMLSAICGLAARHQHDKATELVTIAFGKEAPEEPKEKEKEKDKEKDVKGFAKEKEKEKPGTYAKHSGTPYLFLVRTKDVKDLKEADLRDRASLMNTQARLIASQIGVVAGDPVAAIVLASPYFNGQVHNFDADKIKEIRLTVRTRYELRNFNFERVAKDKDKTWIDKSGLQEFQIDADKVSQFVKDFAKLNTNRFVSIVGGPRGEHKLSPKEFTAKLDLVTDDGKTVTLLVGSRYSVHGYYANSSYWPETVFMLPMTTIDPLLSGVDLFAKERATGD